MIAKLNSLKVPRLKLYQQIIAWFVLVVFLPLLGVTFIIYNINQKALKKELITFTEHTAEAIYKDLETEMSWQSRQIQMLIRYVSDTYADTESLERSVSGALALSDSYEAVGVYDREGKNLVVRYRNFSHLSPELRLPIRLTDSALPDSTLAEAQPGAIHFSVLYANTGDPKDNAYFLRCIVPVNHPTVAYYAVQIRFNYLQKLIRDNSKSLHTSVFIIDNSGEILAGPIDINARQPSISPEDFSFFQSIPVGVTREFAAAMPIAEEAAPVTVEEHEEPKTLQKVFVKMPDVGWGIILESPYNVRQTYVKRARDQSLLLIIACLVLVILLALFYILGINRNFRQLIKAIKAMAEGNYARKIRLITNTITPYEIVYLAGEFNRMGRKMSDAWRKSQALNRELLRRNEEEAFLSRMTKLLHGTLSPEEISRLSTRHLGEYLELGVSALILTNPESGAPNVETAWQHEQLWLWENGQYPEVQAAQVKQLHGARDPKSAAALSAGFPVVFRPSDEPWLQAFNLGPALVQAILYQSQVLGYLILIRPPHQILTQDTVIPTQFSSEETHLVGMIANQIGVALYQANQWHTIQEVNKKLAKLDELKSNLIDTVSHELRTPLTSIKGYTSRLLRYDNSLDGPTRTKSLKVIKQQADRLSRLVEDLLVIPDLETSNLRVFPDQVYLPDLIERSVQFVQDRAQRDIQIQLACPQPPCVLADPDRLEQILLNLLDNAVKYSCPETNIVLSLDVRPRHATEPESVSVCVANQSEPIPADELERLFEKFKRLDDGLTRTTRGSGLGLFITKELVGVMGGDIQLRYEAGWFYVDVSLPVYRDNLDLSLPMGES